MIIKITTQSNTTERIDNLTKLHYNNNNDLHSTHVYDRYFVSENIFFVKEKRKYFWQFNENFNRSWQLFDQ